MSAVWAQPRLWVTVLWAMVLACGVAGWDWAEGVLHSRASESAALLAPLRHLDSSDREALRQELRREPGVASARWMGPGELATELQRRYPGQPWQDLLPVDGEGDWLPWMLELRPSAPLGGATALQALAARLRQQGDWQIFWEPGPLRQLTAWREVLRIGAGVFLVLCALCGAAALAGLPWPVRGSGLFWFASVMLSGLFPAAVAGALWLVQDGVSGTTIALAASAGVFLSGGIAPLLRRRARSQPLSISVKEAPHERE